MATSIPVATGRVVTRVLEHGGPLVGRAAMAAARARGGGGIMASALGVLSRGLGERPSVARPVVTRHPLVPAAIRVEHGRMRRGLDRGDQTAVTMWFGEGPALPSPGQGSSPLLRTAVRIGAGALAAAAVAAAATAATRLEEPRVVEGTASAVPEDPDQRPSSF